MLYNAWAQVKGVDAHALEEYEQVTFPGFTGSYYTETQAAAMEANPDTVIAYKPLTCDRMTFTDTDGNTLKLADHKRCIRLSQYTKVQLLCSGRSAI